MPTVSKVTATLFDQIKTQLDYVSPHTAAVDNHLSMKTILMIKGSADFDEYEAQKHAQHPASNQKPLREMLAEISSKLDRLINSSKENRLF